MSGHLIDQRLEFLTALPGIPEGGLTLTELSGKEGLSRLYRYELTLVADTRVGLPEDFLNALLSARCAVRFGPDALTQVSGVLTSITLTDDSTTPPPIVYRATLVPALWRSTLTVRSRVFQEQDVLGIVRFVLTEDLGMEEGTHFEIHATESYPTLEYTVQYQESNFAFLSRLMEHFGLFYFFTQEPEGEKLMIGDANKAFARYPGAGSIRYVPLASSARAEELGVHRLSREVRVRPNAVLMREYNWRTPAVPLLTGAPADQQTGMGFHYLYAEHWKDAEQGNALAKVRAERLLATRDRVEGECTVPDLAPGHRFALDGHFVGDMDREYAVVSVEHEAVADMDSASATYSKRFVAQPYEVAYRPERVTKKPHIPGIIYAHVDGEVDQTAAPIDELGRYKVLFPFDIAGAGGGKASRWVRMSQPLSGPGYGLHMPLHIGAEVAIAHMNGDPDRPVIMGTIPNASTVSPVIRDNATQSVIKTRSGIRVTYDDDVQDHFEDLGPVDEYV